MLAHVVRPKKAMYQDVGRRDAGAAGAEERTPHPVPASVARAPLWRGLRKAARRIVQAVYSSTEMRIYRMDTADAVIVPAGDALRKDAWPDLQRYRAVAPGDPPIERLLRDAEVRRTAGAHVYTASDGALLHHHSWLMTHGERPGVRFQAHFTLPAGAAFLWDGYTHPDMRGRGYHAASLWRRLADARAAGCRWAYVAVASDNRASRRNIERAGFRHRHTVCTTRIVGLRRVRTSAADASGQDLPPDASAAPAAHAARCPT